MYNCEKCKDTGWVTYEKDGMIYHKECDCVKVKRSLYFAEKSGLGDLLNIYTFERFNTDYDFQKRLYNKAQRYLQEKANKWFVVLGKSGAGKSHICTAICKKFIADAKIVHYVSWLEISRQLKSVINDSEYDKIMAQLKNAEVLYIDDLFKSDNYAKPSPADIKIAIEILNYRYNKARASKETCRTLISSERLFSQLVEYDEATAGRMYEMAGNDYITNLKPEDCFNYRLKNILGK